jgi:hypothetical protein
MTDDTTTFTALKDRLLAAHPSIGTRGPSRLAEHAATMEGSNDH